MTDAGFSISSSKPDASELRAIPRIPEIIILSLDGIVAGYDGTFEFLRHLLEKEEPERSLYFMGTESEIAIAHESFPDYLVAADFVRPININEVTNTLQEVQDHNTVTKPKHRKILIVDDDPFTLNTLQTLFSTKYEVYMASSGTQAIAFFKQNTVDLILLDYEMPEVSGLDVFKILKSQKKTASIPVIFLTAKDEKDIVLKVIVAKPEKYLLKNQPTENLLQAVDAFFKGR
ncbi:MAG: response regulator [Treponema sp.]|nr:response regulator [Treponema sp.]